jgi:hypothetical protein
MDVRINVVESAKIERFPVSLLILDYNNNAVLGYDTMWKYVYYVPPSGLKMEIVYFSETLVSTYESTWRRNPEQHRLHRRDNQKCHVVDNTVF